MQREHFLAQLTRARQALDELIDEIGEEADPRLAEAAAYAMMPEVYTCLNYAWHSRDMDQGQREATPEALLQGFPEEFGL